MKFEFKHKVVVITGATGGIGRALAWRFAKASAHIVLLDLDAELLSALQHQLEPSGVRVMSMVCDITDEERCIEVFQEIRDQFGGVDVLINNAGISQYSRFIDTQESVVRRLMEVNFFGALHCTQASLNSLLERKGMIITLSSILGLVPSPFRSGYSASKHALHGLFDSLRSELVNEDVHIMMACPGKTDTDIDKHVLGGDGSMIQFYQSEEPKASPVDVAEAIFRAARDRQRLVIYAKVNLFEKLLYRYFPSYYEYKILRPRVRQALGSKTLS